MLEDNIFTKERLEEIAEDQKQRFLKSYELFKELDDSEIENGVLVWNE